MQQFHQTSTSGVYNCTSCNTFCYNYQSIAAKADGEPCCDWVGEDGAGHFVKMVHNGIEYGDMQLICEAYHLMKTALSLTNQEMSEVSVSCWVVT